MIPLGKASLATFPHSTGVTAQGWDLEPFGAAQRYLFLGQAGTPLPPAGSVVERMTKNDQFIQIDAGTGEVWGIEQGDPPPTLGPVAGPEATRPGAVAMRTMGAPMLFGIGAALWWFFGRRKRGGRRRR